MRTPAARYSGAARLIHREQERLTAPQDASPAQPKVAIAAYLDALASSAPTPGGGSAAGLTGAMAAALVSMVANLTVGRPRFAGVEAPVRAALDEAEQTRARLLQLTHDDEVAFTRLAEAMKLPRGSDGEKRARTQAMQAAMRAAAQPPLEMARLCRRLLDLALVTAESGNPNLASDAGVAALLAEAALRASAINVRVNLAHLRDTDFVEATQATLNAQLDGTPSLKDAILSISGRRM